MNKLKLQLVTPERTVLESELESLSCPTTEGQITILPNHTALVSKLESGELIAKNNNEEFYIHVAGGFVEVRNDGRIIILADAAEHHFEIDLQRAEQAKLDAQKLLDKEHLAHEEYALASWLLRKNLSRINIATKHAHRKTRSITSEGVFKD
ncbi:MAG: ATP synthase F1 subunit epsilon [Candidatus Doudnabacteria bacterium]